MKFKIFLAIYIIFPLIACAEQSKMDNELNSIGVATMKEDGTVVLQLRAETDSVVGQSVFEYKPDDSDYNDIVEHLGGISPGEEKFVPPWPE